MTVRGVEQIVGGLGRFFVPFLIGVVVIVVIIAILDRAPRQGVRGKGEGGDEGNDAPAPTDVGERGNKREQR